MTRKIFIVLTLSIISMLSYAVCESNHTDFINKSVIVNVSSNAEIVAKTQSSISASEHEIYVPRQTSFSGPNRIQSNVKRTNIQSFRQHLALLKGGKSVKTSTAYINTYEFCRFPSGFSEDTHHLISLGKLII